MNDRRGFLRLGLAACAAALVVPVRALALFRRRKRACCPPPPCCYAATAVQAPAATVNAGSDDGNFFVDSVTNSPETNIHVGDTVQWINYNGQDHTVVSVDIPPNMLNPPLNGNLPSGNPPSTYTSEPFTQPGDFSYRCTKHPADVMAHTGMWGIVHVRPRSANVRH